jgi:anti-sigma factor RsiW
MIEPVSEDEIHAYVDGQLDPRRHAAVERWLAANADVAARVMADRALADLLRNGLTQASAHPRSDRTETDRRARQLGRRLAMRRLTHGLGRAVAAMLLIAVGWGLHAGLLSFYSSADAAARIPVFVDEAADAFRTAMRDHSLEHGLTYQDLSEPSELAALEPDQKVPIPLPGGKWSLVGARMVPWDQGDAAQVFWRKSGDRTLVLFAAGAAPGDVPSLNSDMPQLVVLDKQSYVYWRNGPQVYVLTGSLADEKLLSLAWIMHDQTD